MEKRQRPISVWLQFAGGKQIRGSLYTRDFLGEGICDTAAWKAIDDSEIAKFRLAIRAIYDAFPTTAHPNEATTEQDLIFPTLRALGWDNFLPQQSASHRREDVPDALLFANTEAKAAANREKKSPARYRHGIAIVENKAWDLPLDRGPPDLFNQNAPSTQMLRYLSRVEIESERAIRWGILTNGRLWRLYYQGARSRAEEFLELDLPLLAGVPAIEPDLFSPASDERAHFLKVFLLLFRRTAFLPSADDARSYHDQALALTREWETRISQNLSEAVFGQVFPNLVNALAASDPLAPKPLDSIYLEEVRQAALTLLYRLLFVLYAEDRNLLPSHEKGYGDYSLRALRHELRDGIDRAERYGARADRFYKRLQGVFRLIDVGDTGLGLPPYNGGLFDDSRQSLLARVALPDIDLAPILDDLSRRKEGEARKWINYRDLSVQHLGAIYERLFEFILVPRDGRIAIELTPFARKGSGSYYTHEDLVHLILDKAVGPLIDERLGAFRARAKALAEDRRPKVKRLEELDALDPATRLLELKICDPAMGSGHFLVSLVDYLADQILEAMAEATECVAWADKEQPYISKLAKRITDIRDRILAAAAAEGWHIERTQLDDRHIVRRMILKRVVYGVDKNLMAVELAKVALWLHTFTVGAPLSFLDHHLRCGDSLFGEQVGQAMTGKRGALLINRYVQQAKRATVAMMQVEAATDADIAEVRASGAAFADISSDTRNLTAYLDFIHALRWLDLDEDGEKLVQRLLDGQFGDAVKLISGEVTPIVDDDAAAQRHLFGNEPAQSELGTAPTMAADTWTPLKNILDEARSLAQQERFLHWEVAFPGVWSDWESLSPLGGFDAIIGNPPWDRMKLQDVEWFATRRPEIAKSVRASDRKKMIDALKRKKDPLSEAYDLARQRAEQATKVARKSNYYPLLSGGDLNIYSLFVERGQALIRADGIVGLLVPSGISGDKSASAFFASIATTGRLASLLDFENRWPTYFPDVDSRFKFSVFVASGAKRKFAAATCGFFLHGVDEISTHTFALDPDDFTRVNPNTGTAPVFRTPRDADITRSIYERLPVLVLHSAGGERAAWPVRYSTMLHMTNDSGRFEKREALERKGFYLVHGNRLKKGADEYVPLYEGKMVQAYDHRAANVILNLENLNRPAQPEAPTAEEKASSTWLPASLYWIKADEIEWPRNTKEKPSLEWAVGFKDVTAPTNFRTMIAATVPFAGFGNTLPLLLPILPEPPPEGSSQKALAAWQQARDGALATYRKGAPLLLANFNSLPFDFVARQKIQGQHLNWYIVEQLPVIPAERFEDKIAGVRLSDFVRDQVLHLTYTAIDMESFARDMGYDGAPFPWDDEDRRHCRARLDALFFHLYGIGADDAGYILDTFPIVREHDEADFGRYRTKEMVLAYMRAIGAKDLTSRVSA